MKRAVVIAHLAVAFAAGRAAHAQGPPGNGWDLAFEDNFDGPGLDPVWSVASGARRDAINTPDAVRVAGGNLVITTYSAGGRHYTGFIGSYSGFLGTFGYWEARINFEDSPGMWSAFWVQSPTMGNPIGDVPTAGAEIDIVEHRARSGTVDLRNQAQHTLHWDGYGAAHRSAGSLNNNPGPLSLQGNFHVYGLLWTPTEYRFFVDGIHRWTTAQGLSHRSEFIYLTSEVQNNSWAGSIPTSGYGALEASQTRMTVDWVRVWRRPLYGLDIGNVSIAGSDVLDTTSGTWTVQGSGDTWTASDRFRFVYLPITGDGWIFAQVSGLDNPDPAAKAGLMVRETLAPGAKNATVFLTAGGSADFQSRVSTGGETTTRFGTPGIGAPYMLYLERVGDAFNAYGSIDGVSWDFLGTDVIPMARRAYLGLAVSNHHDRQAATASFDSVSTSAGP